MKLLTACYNSTMLELNEKQKKFLRGLAHAKEPVARAGQAGLTDTLIKEVRAQLFAHELIKFKVVAADRDSRDKLIADICNATGATLVQRIGHVAVLYRRHHTKPKIKLPE
jgi:RNA-binding protein